MHKHTLTVHAYTKGFTNVHTLRHEHVNTLRCSLHTRAPIDLQPPNQTASANQQEERKKEKKKKIWTGYDLTSRVQCERCSTHTHPEPCQLVFEVSFSKPGKVFRFYAFLTPLCFAFIQGQVSVWYGGGSRKTSALFMGTSAESAEMFGEKMEDKTVRNLIDFH